MHELAHYFWNDNQQWINEGMAELLSHLAMREFPEGPVPLASPACRGSIAALERGGSQRCAYAVGERFFSQLREEIGDRPFRKGMRKLMQYGWSLDLDDVRGAFGPIDPGALRKALDDWG